MSEEDEDEIPRGPRAGFLAYLAASAERPALLLAASEEGGRAIRPRGRGLHRQSSCSTLPLPRRPFGDVFDPAVRGSDGGRAAVAAFGPRRSSRTAAFMERTPLYDPMELDAGTEVELDATLERLVIPRPTSGSMRSPAGGVRGSWRHRGRVSEHQAVRPCVWSGGAMRLRASAPSRSPPSASYVS